MINNLLLVALITLGIVYLLFNGKKKRAPGGVGWVLISIPSLVAVVVIILRIQSVTEPIDTRYIDHLAHSIERREAGQDTRYYLVCSDSLEREILPSTYGYYRNLWGPHEEEISEGVYQVRWNGNQYSTLAYTSSESYTDYYRNLQNPSKITDLEAIELGLHVRSTDHLVNSEGVYQKRQRVIYGLPISDSISRSSCHVSTLDSNFRPLLLTWTCNSSRGGRKKIKEQSTYWKEGKNNEVIFCVGLDSCTNKILWSGSFSSAKSKELEDYVLADALAVGDSLCLDCYNQALLNGYSSNLWNPRDNDDYSYILIPVSILSLLCLAALVILLDILLIVKVRKHESI